MAIDSVGTSGLPPQGTPIENDPIRQAVATLDQILSRYTENEISKTGKDGQQVPDATGKPVLDAPTSDLDPSDLAGLLMKLKNATTEAQLKTSKEGILANKDKIQSEHKERLEKLNESIEKMKQAQKSGLLGKIFGWIGMALAVVASVAMLATGIGVGAGLAILTGAVMGMGMMIAAETGGMTKLAQALGPDGFKAFMGAMVALQILLAIASFGGGSASAIINVSTSVAKAAQVVQVGAQVAGGATQIASGAAGIATAHYTRDAEMARADSKEIEKFIKKLQATMQEEQDHIKELIEQLQAGFSIVADIVKSSSETKSKVFQSMSA